MANSTDGEEYENYMKRQSDSNNIQNNRIMGNNINRGGAGNNQGRSSAQDMIYSDQMSRQYVDNRSRNEENIQDENYTQQRAIIDNKYREEIHESTSSQKEIIKEEEAEEEAVEMRKKVMKMEMKIIMVKVE